MPASITVNTSKPWHSTRVPVPAAELHLREAGDGPPLILSQHRVLTGEPAQHLLGAHAHRCPLGFTHC